MLWYSHLFKNIPQFVVIHTVKDFSIVSEAEVNVFLEFSCFFCDPTDVSIVLPFPEYHLLEIISYVAFSDWYLSLTHVTFTYACKIPPCLFVA